jgi:Putative phage tail protein
MARIALAIGGAIVGALLAPFTGGLINPYTGAELGFTVGGVLGGILFPGKLPPGPRLNDLIVSTATDGAPIPFGYGQVRVAGNTVWASTIKEVTTKKSVKGGPKQTTYSYYVSMAVSFGEGPGVISRIWFDSKVVYDPAGTSAAITAISQTNNAITVTSTLNPPTGTQVTIVGVGHGYDGKYQCTNTGPTAFLLFSATTGLPSLGAGGTASFPPPTYPAPTIYTGTETQGADPTVQAALGASITSAFRGLIVAVWNNMPLNDFGNRVPNVRAEITYYVSQTGFGAWGVNTEFLTNAGTSVQTPKPLTPLSPAFNTEMGIWISSDNNLTQHGPAGWLNIVGPCFISPISAPTTPQSSQTGGWALATGLFQFGSPVLTAPITGAAVSGGIVTFDCVSGFLPNSVMVPSGLVAFSNMNGLKFSIISNDGTHLTALAQTGSAGHTADTGTMTWFTYAQVTGLTTGFLSGSGSSSSSFPGNVAKGNLIIAWFQGDNTNGNSPPYLPTGLTDTMGNSYATLSAIQSGTGNAAIQVWYANAIGNGPNTITWHNTNPSSLGGSWQAVELLAGGQSTGSIALSTVDQIVKDICLRTGLSNAQINVSQIASIVAPGGYLVTRPSTGQAALAPLCSAYFFDACETGGQIAFVPRGNGAASLVIPEADLGMQKDNIKLSEEIGQIQDLPAQIQVLYNDRAIDYQQNHTRKIRHFRTVKTKNESVLELPLTIDSTTARQIAERALFLAYLERHPYEINLWKSVYLLYDPTDVINFTYEGLNFVMRVTKMTLGADFTTQLSGVNENANVYQSVIAGNSGIGVTPAKGKTLPDTVLFLFDVPLLRDSDAQLSGSGYYFALSSLSPSTWPGGILAQSSDSVTWVQENTSNVAASYGYATTKLAAPRSPWSWDTINTVTVFMLNGALAGTTMLNVLNGANAILLGTEVIQFVNAVQNLDGSYTLSMLLRGRRGTELSCGTHTSSDAVVYLNDPGVVRQPGTTADLQIPYFYEGVTSGQIAGTLPNQTFTNTGNDLRPYAVTSVVGTRDASFNLTVTWIRRTRIGGDWLEGVGTVPLSESVESYDVDIINGQGTVVRTFAALSSPTVSYTAAQQITDFGNPVGAVGMNIYQNSSVIGRGFVKSVIV